jgi:uridine kinase
MEDSVQVIEHRKKRRTLLFLLQVAARMVFPDFTLRVRYDLPRGYYCEFCQHTLDARAKPKVKLIKMSDILRLKQKMKELKEGDYPINLELVSKEEAMKIFMSQFQPDKAELIRTLSVDFCRIYSLCGVKDTQHIELLPSTGGVGDFDINSFADGFCLRYEAYGDGGLLPNYSQTKIAEALRGHSRWSESLGVNDVGTLNRLIQMDKTSILINLCEARHERMYAAIADEIYAHRDSAKVIFIAGPSSSGKTSSSLRIAQQCRILGLNPKVIELDNYFVDREFTPRDENGEYDFESLGAMQIDLLNQQLESLLAGEEVEIPRYDFATGKSLFEGNKMRLEENDILIMEGIHALNPQMVPGIDSSKIFRVYVSALTSLNIDENVNVSTSDMRLLRRIVRDNRVRSVSPEGTLSRWGSVRRGENRNIFPFQENADVYFNSALLYELPLLKYYAEPLLQKIEPSSPVYAEAQRLLNFLSYVVAIDPKDIDTIPPMSIIREFIGGQCLIRF